jgi:dienelactone hydrolase
VLQEWIEIMAKKLKSEFESDRAGGVSRRRWLQGMGLGATTGLARKLFPASATSEGHVSRAGGADETDQPQILPGTRQLTATGDLSAAMRQGFDRFLSSEIERSVEARQKYWQRNTSSAAAYAESVEPNRERFKHMIGLADPRVAVTALQYQHTTDSPARVAETADFTVYAVSWPVLEGVSAEGLLLEPKGKPDARVVLLPDADQTPEMLAGLVAGVQAAQRFGLTLALEGCQVLILTLIDRSDTWSGNPAVFLTNQPGREWIYRQAFNLGRHIIGYEVQKVVAAIDWFSKERGSEKLGVAGYGEGGLIALYAAAVDTRIDATLVSGYFTSRQQVFNEPIYRNLFGLLREFGDAEIATLIAPRKLIVEHSPGPQVDGPPKLRPGHQEAAAPGILRTPEDSSVAAEVARAAALLPKSGAFEGWITFVAGRNGTPLGPFSRGATTTWLSALGIRSRTVPARDSLLPDARPNFQPGERQRRQLQELVAYNQKLLHESQDIVGGGNTSERFWNKAQPKNADEWRAATQFYRDYYRDEIVGSFTEQMVPADPQSRKAFEKSSWVAYEVVLSVLPDVFLWAYLLLPKSLRPGERRPVVVCVHGSEGVPMDTITDDPKTKAYALYKAFSARLAEQGFVVCAPHGFYRGGLSFRQLGRKTDPLKKTLWALTVAQHQQLLDWLGTLPFVDSRRIGYYGLSGGGSTGMYITPLLEQYSAVVSSAAFSELIHKTVTSDNVYSSAFFEMYQWAEFNIANTFGFAKLASLVAPRPFMVERGHLDGVSPGEWVAYEYDRVQRLYDALGIPERTRIEYFHGGHTIHGVGTFEFLRQQLNWSGT